MSSAHRRVRRDGSEIRSLRASKMNADEIIGLLNFAHGRFPAALVRLNRLARVLHDEEVGEPSLLGAAPERIEALARTGRTDEANAALAEFERHATHTDSSWGQAAARGVEASPHRPKRPRRTLRKRFDGTTRCRNLSSRPAQSCLTVNAYAAPSNVRTPASISDERSKRSNICVRILGSTEPNGNSPQPVRPRDADVTQQQQRSSPPKNSGSPSP